MVWSRRLRVWLRISPRTHFLRLTMAEPLMSVANQHICHKVGVTLQWLLVEILTDDNNSCHLSRSSSVPGTSQNAWEALPHLILKNAVRMSSQEKCILFWGASISMVPTFSRIDQTLWNPEKFKSGWENGKTTSNQLGSLNASLWVTTHHYGFLGKSNNLVNFLTTQVIQEKHTVKISMILII